MVVMEYKLTLADDFRIGDTIMITNKTSSGWKGMVNNKYEITFEMNTDNTVPLLIDGWILVDVNDRWEKMWACCRDGPFQIGFFKSEPDKMIKKSETLFLENLVHIEELEVVQATNPQNPPIRFSFRTTVKTYNLIIPTKEGMVTTSRAIMKALKNKEKTLSRATPPPPTTSTSSAATSKPMLIPQQQQQQQASANQLSRSAPQTSPTHFREPPQQQNHQNHHNHTVHNMHPIPNMAQRDHTQVQSSHAQQGQNSNANNHQTPAQTTQSTNQNQSHYQEINLAQPQKQYQAPNQIQNQLATQLIMDKKVQIQAPPPSSNPGRSSPGPGPGQSQIGGTKWLTNIKNIVNPKAASSLNVAQKGKDEQKKAQSVMMNKSLSAPDLPVNTRNTQNIALAVRLPPATQQKPALDSPKGDRKILTRVYWRDGTYTTVEVLPGITAKEVCEYCTKKTKVAIFENLFCLYECLADGSEHILDPKMSVSELLMGWGEDSENHLVCDLNLGTKNTVKTQLRKTQAMAHYDSDDDSESDLDTNDFGQLDDLDGEPTEEDESIAMMIQEMIKLKHQLQEEDEMIERLAVEEQEVDMLISRLANL